MPKYTVYMTAMAVVKTSVTLYADSHEEADKKALEKARSGDVVWTYEGLGEEEGDEPSVNAITEEP